VKENNMKSSLLALSLLFSVSSFANSVSCYVDKVSSYANGRPSHDVIIVMDISDALHANVQMMNAEGLFIGLSPSENSVLVKVGEGEVVDGRLSNEKEVLSLNVAELLATGKGNLGSDPVTLSTGMRIQLRCDGKP
jgi:hypothetical protein